jgi:hypothetical protein
MHGYGANSSHLLELSCDSYFLLMTRLYLPRKAKFKHPDERTAPTAVELSNSDPATEPEGRNDARLMPHLNLVSHPTCEQ